MTAVVRVAEPIVVSAVFSEGRSPKVIDKIAVAIEETPGISLINVDPNRRYNRTMVLYGGGAEAVLQAALRSAALVGQHINLATHQGEASPLGALEFVSFIPLHTKELPAAVRLAKKFAREIAGEYHIPVYLLGFASRQRNRGSISYFRKFNHEQLPELLKQKPWQPDYGPARYDKSWGAAVVGARYFHINLAMYWETEDTELVEGLLGLSGGIEFEGKSEEDFLRRAYHKIDHQQLAELRRKTHLFVEEVPDRKMVRLICNIPDYNDVPLYQLVDSLRQAFSEMGIDLHGNQILGFAPAEALIRSGRHYLHKRPDTDAKDELRCITMAVKNLALNAIEPFDLKRQVLDYHFEFDSDHI